MIIWVILYITNFIYIYIYTYVYIHACTHSHSMNSLTYCDLYSSGIWVNSFAFSFLFPSHCIVRLIHITLLGLLSFSMALCCMSVPCFINPLVLIHIWIMQNLDLLQTGLLWARLYKFAYKCAWADLGSNLWLESLDQRVYAYFQNY